VDLPGLDPQLHQEIPLKADPFVQLKLLDVQELDSRIDHLNHQLSSIPEAERLRELAGRRTAMSNAVRDLRIQVDDLTAEQKRADADVEQVKTRRARDQGMIDAGQVKDPKALERMLGELESLHRRITSLEDTELEVMERLEEAQSALEERSAELSEMEGQEAELRSAFEQKAGDLRTELEQVRAERATMVPGMPEDLLALYEKLRAQKGGVGAAALRRRACEGCRLTLNASDLGIIAKKPTDDVVRCEECDRILVRTGESGLGSPV
jgi:predicted  nucleic acid-binding Zn-ribbon protein